MDNKTTLKVNIFGTEYPIKSNTDTEYIKQVADFVDRKMREIDKNISVKSSLKVAILAALNIADELFQERKERERLVADLEDRAREISDSLAQVLEE
ncbi:cell division protein ZapA [candidate division KSB1 bacterium]|nr:cell division protein ZapA [candidate division KSB1 bacterium]